MKKTIRINNPVEATEPVLFSYIRGRKNQPIACVAATKSGENIVVGWSACNPHDTFCKETGRKIAVARAIRGSKAEPAPYLKETLEKTIQKIRERAYGYFKLATAA